MSLEDIKFSWNSFQEQLLNNRKSLFEEKLFSDVILVSDDLIPIEAHKSVLSSASPIFKKLLLMNDGTGKPIIFLKSLKHKQLMSLVKFIYIGEIGLTQNEVEEFIEIGKDFDIHDFDIHDGFQKELEEELTEEEKLELKIAKNGDAGGSLNVSQPRRKKKQYHYPCNQCDKVFGNKFHHTEHVKVVHEESRFECNKCDKSFTSSYTLANHIKLHESIPFPFKCEISGCGKRFRFPMSVTHHRRAQHEDRRIPCPKKDCKHTFKFRSNIARHVKTQHPDSRTL